MVVRRKRRVREEVGDGDGDGGLHARRTCLKCVPNSSAGVMETLRQEQPDKDIPNVCVGGGGGGGGGRAKKE